MASPVNSISARHNTVANTRISNCHKKSVAVGNAIPIIIRCRGSAHPINTLIYIWVGVKLASTETEPLPEVFTARIFIE
jgi:hypothetical protein